MDLGTSLFLNVLGGLLATAIAGVAVWLWRLSIKFHLRRVIFKHRFSLKSNENISLVYAKFILPEIYTKTGERVTHPYLKPTPYIGERTTNMSFSINNPVSECEVRAATYLLPTLNVLFKPLVKIKSDADEASTLDANFVALGGPGSNYKTRNVLEHKANAFAQITSDFFDGKTSFNATLSADYGIILRITPNEFAPHSWLICAGHGEWGSSGSAWFLSKRWSVLARKISWLAYYLGFKAIPDFLAIVRVNPTQDESATIVALYCEYRDGTKKLI